MSKKVKKGTIAKQAAEPMEQTPQIEEVIEPVEEAKAEPEPGAAVEEKIESTPTPLPARWKACSNLSTEGKHVANPGDIVTLPPSLAQFYLDTAPGSIEPAE